MKSWAPLFIPITLFAISVWGMFACPEVSKWNQYLTFLYLPYLIVSLAFLLGCAFAQSRVSFMCLMIAVVTYLAHNAYFSERDMARGDAIVFAAAIYLPLLAVLFYRLSERGVFSVHGWIRIGILFSALIVIYLLPVYEGVRDAVDKANFSFFSSLRSFGRFPEIGVIMLVLATPAFMFPVKNESPFLGPVFLLGVIFVFAAFVGAMNSHPKAWGTDFSQGMFLLFMSGAGVTFMWAVIESSWRSSHMDELTGLPGRRALKHHMDRLGKSYAIAMLDIDHFKKINDKHGHSTGDQVLKFIAAQLKRNPAGEAYRYGGEEFAIICEGGDYDEIQHALDIVRKSINERRFTIRAPHRPKKKPKQGWKSSGEAVSIKIGVSIGVAKRCDIFPAAQDVLAAADKALYKAKNQGRNTLVAR